MGVVFGLISMVSWGAGDFVAASLSRSLGNLRAILWVTVFGNIAILSYGFFTGALGGLTVPGVLYAGAAGFLHSIGSLSFYKGLKVGRVSLVAPISSGWSVILVLAAILLYGEELTFFQYGAVALVITGGVLVSANLKELRYSGFTLADPGIPYAFVAMFAWGFGWLFFNESVKTIGWVLPNILLASFIILFLLCYAGLSRQSVKPPAGRSDWMRALFVGFATILAYIAYSIGIESYLTSIVAPLAAAYPLVTVILAVLIFRERSVFNQKVGIVAVISGVILMST